jgi:hypothetical protein
MLSFRYSHQQDKLFISDMNRHAYAEKYLEINNNRLFTFPG